ncbi:hypothetical protein [Anabaena sp. CCY 0017]|uniref:hypothetical protein n=1 Tax=Anabaena sp. CCY 0017 TaxID=3103866 RepID=UPI0039C5C696
MKELKNKVDSIRRTLKAKGINEVTATQIEAKILELCPDFPDDWCSDIRTEVINNLVADLKTPELEHTELAPVESELETTPSLETSEELQTIAPLETPKDLETIAPLETSNHLVENTQSGELALQETSELVASTAESMGIALNIEDVTAIAENFDYASTNSDDELEEIKTAITAFVQHKAALSRQKIQHIVQEVKQTIHNLDAENSELLNDGLRSISQDIKSGSERFRQQTRQALKVFALPPSKAG